ARIALCEQARRELLLRLALVLDAVDDRRRRRDVALLVEDLTERAARDLAGLLAELTSERRRLVEECFVEGIRGLALLGGRLELAPLPVAAAEQRLLPLERCSDVEARAASADREIRPSLLELVCAGAEELAAGELVDQHRGQRYPAD